MTLLLFKAKNHPQQIERREIERKQLALNLINQCDFNQENPREDSDDRAVPSLLFAAWNKRFLFSVDVAASPLNKKLPRYYTSQANGLNQSWACERVYCNPPFSNIEPWIKKAWSEIDAQIIVMLLPANRTEQAWWQTLVEPKRDRTPRFTCEFLPRRIKFLSPGETEVRSNNRPPFGCCFLIWNNSDALKP
jgi:phage N-6-adenine-methyltransferase